MDMIVLRRIGRSYDSAKGNDELFLILAGREAVNLGGCVVCVLL